MALRDDVEITIFESGLVENSMHKPISEVSYEDFKPEVQELISLVGRAVFRNNHGGYHAVHPPKSHKE